MRVTLNKQQFFSLLPVFVLMVVIGTLHHETGHYLAARWMGLRATIHYNYTHVATALAGQQLTVQQLARFISAGPLQTMLTGTVALLILCFIDRQSPSSTTRYIFIFIAFFWVRQPVNFVLYLFQSFTTGHYSERGDEAKLSLYFHWPVWSLNAATAILGIFVIVIIIFRFLPVQQRFTFWLAGSVGGGIGFYLWMIWLGKYILP